MWKEQQPVTNAISRVYEGARKPVMRRLPMLGEHWRIVLNSEDVFYLILILSLLPALLLHKGAMEDRCVADNYTWTGRQKIKMRETPAIPCACAHRGAQSAIHRKARYLPW